MPPSNDSGKGESEDISLKSLHLKLGNGFTDDVDLMTSREFQSDTKAHVECVGELFKDYIRITTFKNAILHNKHLFKDRIVLNLNCGIGIYALFAAKAGAAKIYAVDDSNVVYYTKRIVNENGFKDKIEVFKCNVKNLQLPVDKVDIIVSDWMGYALYYQSTCVDVIYARDKWLKKPGGLIFPDQAKLYITAIEDERYKTENVDWWKDVYGFNMNCLREFALKEPRYQTVRPEQILSKHYAIKILNLSTASLEDLKLCSKYILTMQRGGEMDGIALYFRVCFSKCHKPMRLDTDPWSPATSWMQTICYFDQPLSVNKDYIYYGGIEIVTSKSNYDFNDVVINMEMLKGDPCEAELEVDMSWHMTTCSSHIDTNKIQITKNNNDVENITKTNKEILQESPENKIIQNIEQFQIDKNVQKQQQQQLPSKYEEKHKSQKFIPRTKTRNAVLLSLQSSMCKEKNNTTKIDKTVDTTNTNNAPLSVTIGDNVYYCRKQKYNYNNKKKMNKNN